MTRPAEAGRGSTPTRSPWWVSLWRRLTGAYPGDFTGTPEMRYSPVPDGRPDPGEIVWTWVPFEENHRSGKDRPVLLVGRDGRWLLGLMLTTRSRSRVEEERGFSRRRWVAIGTGSWDRQRRPSEVRVDRIVRIEPRRVRRGVRPWTPTGSLTSPRRCDGSTTAAPRATVGAADAAGHCPPRG